MKSSSSQPRKQRKRAYNIPLHKKKSLLSAKLAPELAGSYGKRSLPVREGDQVEVIRGEFYGTRGAVSKVDRRNAKLAIDNVTREKVDGSKVHQPVHPSNVMITKLNLDDEKRKEILRGI